MLQARAATSEYERLKAGPLAGHELDAHARTDAPVREAGRDGGFASGSAQILVATTVIEVGIDIPNATVMLIEDADRYGISQLHQLRGRIGRGEHASLCLLFGRRDSRRLQALAGESDGFKLAEIDLELRGEGELVGTRQSGIAQYRFVEFPRDAELQERARLYGRSVMDRDPALVEPEHALIAEALRARYGDEAQAPIRA